MNRKIMGLILGTAVVLIVAALSMGAISAANPTDVTVGEQTFHIPDGFSEFNSTEDGDTISKFFKNGTGAIISISVFKPSNPDIVAITDIPLSDGDVNKTIGGISGNYNNATHSFRFIKDGKCVISVSAPDDATIESIIK